MSVHRPSRFVALPLVLVIGLALEAGSQNLFTPLRTTSTADVPGRVAVRPGGGFAVVFRERQRVILYDAAGLAQSTFGVGGIPLSIAVLNNGEILIGDDLYDEIGRYDATGTKIGFLGAGNGEVLEPADIAVDRDAQRIYVADAVSHHIRVFNWDGQPIGNIGSKGSANGEFDHPISICVQPSSGDVYVAEFKNQRIQVLDKTGAFLRTFGNPGSRAGEIFRPGGVAVDGQGRVLVSDMYQGWVQAFDGFGLYLGQCAGYGTGNGQLENPVDVAVDEANQLLVASTSSTEIEVFTNLAGGSNKLPTTPVPAVRATLVSYLAPYFDPNSSAAVDVFRIEIWGVSVRNVVANSVKLNNAVTAVSLKPVAGARRGVFDAAFVHTQVAALDWKHSQWKDRWAITIDGSLDGGGKFHGDTIVKLNRQKKNKKGVAQ